MTNLNKYTVKYTNLEVRTFYSDKGPEEFRQWATNYSKDNENRQVMEVVCENSPADSSGQGDSGESEPGVADQGNGSSGSGQPLPDSSVDISLTDSMSSGEAG